MKLTETFKQLIARHESLRTSFHVLEEQPVQRVHKEVEFAIEYEYDEDADETIIQDFVRPFDLSRVPLLRVRVIHTPPFRPLRVHRHFSPAASTTHQEESLGNKYILLVDMHHIISDGVSHGVLVKDFHLLYNGEELPSLRLQYKDYVKWQNSDEIKESMKRQEEYWLSEFSGEIPLLNLPTDYTRPDKLTFEGSTLSFLIDPTLTARLKKCAAQLEVTSMMFLLSVYKILLAKCLGQEEILVGTVIAGREHADLENIIGYFVNMLAIKTRPNKSKTFSEYVLEVKKKALKAYENQGYPFEELVDKLKLERQASRHPLVETVFVLQNFGEEWNSDLEKESDNSTQDLTGHSQNVSHFDILFIGFESHDSITFNVEYSTALFKESSIQGLSEGYLDILEQVVENKDIKWEEIEIRENFLKQSSDLLKDHDISFEF